MLRRETDVFKMVKIRDVMSSSLIFVGPDDSVMEAARLLRENNVGMLPVFDGIHFYGVVTDRDIALRNVSEEKGPEATPVSSVMTANTVCCPEDYTVEKAVRIMIQENITRLIITGPTGRPAGVVSLGDVTLRAKRPGLSAKIISANHPAKES